MALFAVARSCGLAVTAPTALVAASVTLLGRGHPLPPPVADEASNVLASVLVIAAAEAVKHWRHAVEVRRRLPADRAVAQEHRRIARELHDIVARHLTTMQLSGPIALREMRHPLDVLRAGDEPEEKARRRRRPRRNPVSGASDRSSASPGGPDCPSTSRSAQRNVRCRRAPAWRCSGSSRSPSPTPASTPAGPRRGCG
ncbi:hypothetical protein ACQB60_29865 [Actinomycetota bacterium Odt1-20B]